MADIIDSFIVSLGIDASQYNKEIKNFRDDRKRLGEEEKRANRDTEDAQKRMAGGFRTLRNEAAGFLFVLAGASGVKQFVGNILAGDAAVGRLAKNLGVATESLSAWQGAVKRVGGGTGDIDSAFRSISGAYQNLQLTGTTGNDADFQGLGVGSGTLRQGPEATLLKISEASSRMSRPEFGARLGRLGFNEATITLLSKGRVEVERMIVEQRRLGVTTDANAEAAQKFDDQLAKLETAIKGKLRPAIEGMVGTLIDWLEKGDNLNNLLLITDGLLIGVGVAAASALGPLGLMAAAVATLAMAFADLNKAGSAWQIVGLRASKYYHDLRAAGTADPKLKMYHLEKSQEAADSILRLTEAANSTPNYGYLTQGSGGLGLTGNGMTTSAGGLGGGASGGGSRNAATVEQYFKSKGYSSQQAKGITAGVVAEGGLSQRTGGGYQGRALGIGQLLGSRRAAFLKRYGNNFTLQNELDFMHWELQGGDKGGAAVLAQTSAGGTLNAMVNSFYRPAAGAETAGDLRRGNAWLNGGGVGMARTGGAAGATVQQTTTVGQVIVYSAATDAEGVARDMRGALAKRGLVTQANTGLTG